MKKKQVPEKLKKIIRDALERYKWRIGVTHYYSKILYMEDDRRYPNDEYVWAEMTTDYKYLKADLKIFPFLVEQFETKKADKRDIELVVAHEVGHIVTTPLMTMIHSLHKTDDEVKTVQEQTTELIGRLLYNTDEWKKL